MQLLQTVRMEIALLYKLCLAKQISELVLLILVFLPAKHSFLVYHTDKAWLVSSLGALDGQTFLPHSDSCYIPVSFSFD